MGGQAVSTCAGTRSELRRRALRAAGILRHAQEHRAAAQLEVASAFIETENRIRAEAGKGLIGESGFRGRLYTSAHSCAVVHFVLHSGRSRRGLRRNKLHIFDHLTDACLLQLRGRQLT